MSNVDRVDEEGTVVRTARGDEAKPNGQDKYGASARFPLVPFDKLQVGTERSYLIKGLMPRVGLIVVWGPKKCGKSFWTFDAMLHVALGWEYRGRHVVQGPIVYCAFEGADGYKKRAEAFRRQNFAEGEAPAIDLFLVPARLDLIVDAAALAESIAATLVELTPVAIVLDTLNRSLVGSESKDEDMAAYIAAADMLRERFNCAVIVVHHCGVNEDRPRGHTSLAAAADAQLAITRDMKANIITVEVEWMKDGPEGDKIVSRLETVELGVDDDGDPITSCIIEPASEDDAPRSPPTRKLSDKQKNAVDALTTLVASNGQPVPAAFELPAGVLAVPVTMWRDDLFRRGVLEADAKNPRTYFRNLKEALKARKIAAERDGLIWLA